MSKLKHFKSSNSAPNIITRNMNELADEVGNVYRAIDIIGKRSNQISAELKEELHAKLEEFATSSDALEEVHENREQIEISKFYEKLPHPTLLAFQEFKENKIYHRNKDEE